MQTKFRISLLLITVLAFVVLFASTESALATQAPVDPEPVDLPPDVRAWKPTADRLQPLAPGALAEAEAAGLAAAQQLDCVLDSKLFLTLDSANGFYFFTNFLLLAQGDDAQIWVQENMSWPEGDPRETPVVTCEQAEYMLGEFENNIYPTEVDFFGPPDFHDGSNATLPDLAGLPPDYYEDEAGRQVVLVANVRDENYYDPTFPLYIAGFYSDALESWFDRNTMTIDGFDWENRIGPVAERPFLYEGIFAHEYQHLLHSDYDGDEVNWINEGLSDLAEFLVGYGHPDSHVAATADLPENSLVVWEDQGPLEILSDYGHAYFFMLYLLEQYGQGAIQTLFHNSSNDITGVQETLDAVGSDRDFAAVYRDYAVALLIDSSRGGRQYQFQNIDFNLNVGTPSNPNPEAFSMPGAPPWGTDYVWLENRGRQLVFDGADFTSFPTAWTSDGEVLWGGTGDLVDHWAIFETTGGGTLSFDTMYEIEEGWDFGFVQVSTDGGQTWTSLANEYTTSEHNPAAHPKIVENVPGLTGSSGGWINMSFDLSAYAGQDILVAFRYVTDWATTLDGWYVDNIYVDDTLISDGSSTEPFSDITEIIPVENDFIVSLVARNRLGTRVFYRVVHLDLDDMTEQGTFDLSQLMDGSTRVMMLVTFAAPEGHTEYAEYGYGFARINSD